MIRCATWLALAAGLAAAACADSVSPPAHPRDLDIFVPRLREAEPQPGPVQVARGDSAMQKADDIPPEYQGPASVIDAWTTAWFDGDYAMGRSSMYFTGTDGTVNQNLDLYYRGEMVIQGHQAPPQTYSRVIPVVNQYLSAFDQVMLGHSCGQTVHVDGSFTASIRYLGTNLSTDPDTKSGNQSQGDCPSSTRTVEENSGGGGWGGYYTCYYLIEYYIDDGEIISVTPLGCEYHDE